VVAVYNKWILAVVPWCQIAIVIRRSSALVS
jgi:hypothetical protein